MSVSRLGPCASVHDVTSEATRSASAFAMQATNAVRSSPQCSEACVGQSAATQAASLPQGVLAGAPPSPALPGAPPGASPPEPVVSPVPAEPPVPVVPAAPAS